MKVEIPMRLGRSDVSPLNETQRTHLLSVIQSPGYTVMLDIMERACLQQQTRMVNAPTDNDPMVLAEHKITKAMWGFFIAVQKNVEWEINELYSSLEGQPVGPGGDENILDPTK